MLNCEILVALVVRGNFASDFVIGVLDKLSLEAMALAVEPKP